MGKVIALSVLANNKIKQSIAEHDIIFWSNDKDIAVPNDAWTPFPFQRVITTLCEDTPNALWGVYARPTDVTPFTPVATTCTGIQALPQATINVADTSLMTSTGFATIRANSLAGAETVVKYTGKGPTTLTGCTGGTGTTAAADVVRQANCVFEKAGGAGPATVEVAWAHNATGVRGVRFRVLDGVFNFPGGTDVRPAAAAASPNALLRCQSTEQPVNSHLIIPGPALGIMIEVYQNSGGVLNCVAIPAELSAPRLVAMNLSPVDISTIF